MSSLSSSTRPTEWSSGCPVIAGSPGQRVFLPEQFVRRVGNWDLCEAGSWLIGRASVAVGSELADATESLYAQLFAAMAGRYLCRIWNYIPDINASGLSGLENYRAFSLGRSLAFEKHFGADFKRQLPAASAVGTRSNELMIVAAASVSRPSHYENPRQVPAYDYPDDYGPRPPSFARASVLRDGDAVAVFISGTSAISGHATIAPFDTIAQVHCTVKNLHQISAASGLGRGLAAGRDCQRDFRVYLRNPDDYESVAATLQTSLVRAGDEVVYLHADICRRELNVEIEVTLRGSAEVLA